jgi:flagellar motor switch protein FliM
MAVSDVLNQEEIDALINGVDSGTVNTTPAPAPGEVRPYDFASQLRIVRGRLPTLEMINERFARLLRTSMFELLRRMPQIAPGPVRVVKFNDYVPTLILPTSLNLVRVSPLRGTALIVLDPRLVFAAVDNFFGGSGRSAKLEGRDFTQTENRIIQLLLRHVFEDLQEAWSSVAAIKLDYIGSEMNPQFANIVSPGESVAVSSFRIDMEGIGGDLHITLPMSMLEPLRELLDSGVASDRMDADDSWLAALKEEIEDADVELSLSLGSSQVTLRQLVAMKAGDILPCDFNGRATVVAEDVPVFRGNFGVSRGMHAVKLEERVMRNKQKVLDQLMPARVRPVAVAQ